MLSIMETRPLHERLAVCSWSLQPADPTQLIESLDATGLKDVQLALDPLREQPDVWSRTADVLARNRMSIVSGMFGTIGEDYSTLDSIKRTGGLVPDEHWDQNWKNVQVIAAIARRLHLKLVTFHAGFLPHEGGDPDFKKLLDRIGRVADLFGAQGIDLGFETGQETAETLAAFLTRLDRPNVGVNFDAANMILYDKGDPIAALRLLGPWLKQCHLKDANRTQMPGTWGEEVVVGTGEVDWRAFFATLQQLAFTGCLCIEREAGSQRVADIVAARQLVEKLAG